LDALSVSVCQALIITPLSLAEKEENKSFAVGHFALGYLVSKASAKLLKTDLNLPLILSLSVIPDADIVVNILAGTQVLAHRGPTHSIIAALVLFTPFLVTYKKEAVPYLVALVQHSLVGDYIAGGGVQLLWPLAFQGYGLRVDIRSTPNMATEWVLFLVAMTIMLQTKDMAKLFKPSKTSLILAIPMFTVLLPTFLSFPLYVPLWLIPPHLIYTALFSAGIIIELLQISKSARTQNLRTVLKQ
jgi:membrane-bound metal-dependent hydrolase YbcI (DUF457 family)